MQIKPRRCELRWKCIHPSCLSWGVTTHTETRRGVLRKITERTGDPGKFWHQSEAELSLKHSTETPNTHMVSAYVTSELQPMSVQSVHWPFGVNEHTQQSDLCEYQEVKMKCFALRLNKPLDTHCLQLLDCLICCYLAFRSMHWGLPTTPLYLLSQYRWDSLSHSITLSVKRQWHKGKGVKGWGWALLFNLCPTSSRVSYIQQQQRECQRGEEISTVSTLTEVNAGAG